MDDCQDPSGEVLPAVAAGGADDPCKGEGAGAPVSGERRTRSSDSEANGRGPICRIGDIEIVESAAEFYDTGRRRLWLTRGWGADRHANRLMVIGLNPSKAGMVENDATIRVVVGFAHRWGFGAIDMVNLNDWIETDSTKLPFVAEPNGSRNNAKLEELAANARAILCCWGDGDPNRAGFVLGMLWEHRTKMFCIGRTKSGYPKHPLRQPVGAERIPMVGT